MLIGHRGSAGGAELRAFSYHAARNFRHVRNKIGAELHRILRAGLARLGTALGARSIKSHEKCADRQGQPADET